MKQLTIGHLKITALPDGDRDLDHITEAFPDVPPEALLGYRDRYPGVHGVADAWRLRVHTWLIHHADGLILFDTGVGPPTAPAFGWFGEGGRLMAALGEAGASPHDVGTVVISHVHDDHIGGTVTSDGEPAFPSARYVIQRADWEWQRNSATEDEEDRVIWEMLLEPLERAGVVDLLDGDHDLGEGLQLHHAPGHTPGHQVVRIASGGRRALLSADAFNHPAQLAHPEWPSGSDAEPARAGVTRRGLLAELDAHPDTVVGPSHFAEPFGLVKAGEDGLAGWEAYEG